MRTKRITLVLPNKPETFEEEYAIADGVRQRYGPYLDDIWWEFQQELPDGIDVGSADQLEAHFRDSGEDAHYLVVWMRDL